MNQQEHQGATGLAPVTIRKAHRSDVATLRELHRCALNGLGTPSYRPSQLAAFLAHVPTLDLALIDDGTYFVAQAGDALVACGGWSARGPGYGPALGLHGGEDAAGSPALIRAMYTHPGWARRGLGRRILAAAESEIRAAGRSIVTLDALLPGVPLYASAGYAATRRFEVTIAGGTPLELVHMRKHLQASVASREPEAAATRVPVLDEA
jgi:GNAT superfamily N-acetyltransferase